MAKEKETENRSERERFLDCMLKEILSGQRNPGDRLPTESELAEQYGLRKTNVHLGLQELERLGFLKVVPRHATYVAPYWEQANLETLAAIMTHGGKPQPELVDAFLELREGAPRLALLWCHLIRHFSFSFRFPVHLLIRSTKKPSEKPRVFANSVQYTTGRLSDAIRGLGARRSCR